MLGKGVRNVGWTGQNQGCGQTRGGPDLFWGRVGQGLPAEKCRDSLRWAKHSPWGMVFRESAVSEEDANPAQGGLDCEGGGVRRLPGGMKRIMQGTRYSEGEALAFSRTSPWIWEHPVDTSFIQTQVAGELGQFLKGSRVDHEAGAGALLTHPCVWDAYNLILRRQSKPRPTLRKDTKLHMGRYTSGYILRSPRCWVNCDKRVSELLELYIQDRITGGGD